MSYKPKHMNLYFKKASFKDFENIIRMGVMATHMKKRPNKSPMLSKAGHV